MTGPWGVWKRNSGGKVLVGQGRMVLFCFDQDDLGMRNLAMVALSDAPAMSCGAVAALFAR
ncbi:MAG: hypothetical protein ACRDY2_05210 [Acidimicrobiales bacterium]